ncbi:MULTISPECIES: Hcp family type VI secretion system effector [unclassified Pseudomonas]|uniref:Hcp family type VI secretion system effector n=1 Tax=unclassified Pseudomonas TaxID=196821 RepID=UPI000A1F859A|nr:MULTISPECIES: Hcp family type VI secretion system effector [unclassified Pseudomonas]MDI2141601.1 Hcp family type VI secretion system effector [Pseudomonas sp. ITA]
MANPGYMTIKGKTQGLISAGCSTAESVGNTFQTAHTNEIMVLSYSHNMANAGNINHPTHAPVIITKRLDKSSPLLAQALANREEVSCRISLYRTSPQGQQEKFYSVSIDGAVLVDLSLDLPHAILQNDAEPQEQLALRYREIRWVHHIAGTTGYASWGEED